MGVFVLEELGPLALLVVIMLPSSIPLLMKVSFWKKIIFLIPIIVLRVFGKFLLSILGKHTFVYILRRYRSLEVHYIRGYRALGKARDQLVSRWQALPRHHQTYLTVIFLPLALAITLFVLVIKLLRLKLVQLAIEKGLGLFVTKIPLRPSADIEDKLRRLHQQPADSSPDSRLVTDSSRVNKNLS